MIKPRARDLGIPFEGNTGAFNSITDVSGVTVGYVTVIESYAAPRKIINTFRIPHFAFLFLPNVP